MTRASVPMPAASREGGPIPGGGHDFDLPDLPDAVDIFDTTLRDGSQQEGLSLTVDDKLRVAEQLDHLGVTFIEGGLAGRQSEGRGVLRPGPGRARACPRPPWWPSARPAAPGCGAEDDEVAAPPGRRPTPRRSASWPRRRRCTSPTPCGPRWTRPSPWWPTRWRSSAGTTCESSSTPSTSSTATGTTRNSRCASCGPPKRPVPRPWCSATPTVGPCPTTWSASWPRRRGRVRVPDRGPFPQRLRLRRGQLVAAVRAGATHVQGCVNGYGERTGNADLSAAIPNLSLKLRVRTIPTDRLELITPGLAPHRRAGQHRAQPSAALRRAPPPSPTRPGSTPAPSPAAGRL